MLTPEVRELAQGPNYAALAVLLSDGRPMNNIMWVDCDEDHLLINTEVHRAKFKAMQADPRVSVTIWEAGNPLNRCEVRGTVVDTVTGPAARDHIDQLSRKYFGTDYENPIESERVIVKIEPNRQIS
jgi:PPOX class probable F420-dependent enzyme